MDLIQLFLLPAGLGLLGFIEPCSLGATLVVLRHLESQPARERLAELLTFALVRAGVAGLLGVAAVVLGRGFTGFQKGMWLVLGSLYLVLGGLLLRRRTDLFARLLALRLPLGGRRQGAVTLGLVLGLGIPACAAPLLFALFALAAARGAAGATLLEGFVGLAVFGLFLSAPLLLAAVWQPARHLLERLAARARLAPVAAGLLLVALGLWSIAMALWVRLEDWA